MHNHPAACVAACIYRKARYDARRKWNAVQCGACCCLQTRKHTAHVVPGTEGVVDDQILDYCSLDEQVEYACYM